MQRHCAAEPIVCVDLDSEEEQLGWSAAVLHADMVHAGAAMPETPHAAVESPSADAASRAAILRPIAQLIGAYRHPRAEVSRDVEAGLLILHANGLAWPSRCTDLRQCRFLWGYKAMWDLVRHLVRHEGDSAIGSSDEGYEDLPLVGAAEADSFSCPSLLEVTRAGSAAGHYC